MNCPLRRLCFVALAGLVLSFSARASAQPVVDVPRIEVATPPEKEQIAKPPEPPSERTLVAAVRSSRGNQPPLVHAMEEHLLRRGLPRGEALESSLPCDSAECLEDLVRRLKVGFLFSAQVDESGADTFAITVTLFDVVRRASLQETASCWLCNEAMLGYKLNDVADVLISRCREARQGATVPNQTLNAPIISPVALRPPVPAQNPPALGQIRPAERGFFAKLPRSRRILTGVLGSLAGAALLTSVVLTATDGLDTPLGCDMRTDVLQDKCVLKNKSLYATGYVLTGALAIGLGFTLFWPTKSASSVAPEVH